MPTSLKTVIVAIPESLNNFDVLGCRYRHSDSVEIVITRVPCLNVRGTQISCNFDLIIDHGMFDEDYANFLPNHRCVKLNRYSKLTQMLRLINATAVYERDYGVNLDNVSSFMHIPTWRIGFGHTRNVVLLTEHVIIKPQYGARGIGRFSIDGRYVNLHHFQQELLEFLGDESKYPAFDKFMARWKEHVKYSTEGEFHPNEGLESLRAHGLLVQSQITGIAHEYRLITGNDGLPVYTQRREIIAEDSGITRVTGRMDVLNHIDPIDYRSLFVTEHDLRLFEHFCKTTIGPLNSIDLFIRKDGRWGIFEFCNQFGISGIPQDSVLDIHQNFLSSLVDRFLRVEMTPSGIE